MKYWGDSHEDSVLCRGKAVFFFFLAYFRINSLFAHSFTNNSAMREPLCVGRVTVQFPRLNRNSSFIILIIRYTITGTI